MLEFETFVARHGEVVAQALIENIERFEGVRSNSIIPLEQRWQVLMQQPLDQRIAA
jgi:hypothetical protein